VILESKARRVIQARKGRRAILEQQAHKALKVSKAHKEQQARLEQQALQGLKAQLVQLDRRGFKAIRAISTPQLRLALYQFLMALRA
jgi:transposase